MAERRHWGGSTRTSAVEPTAVSLRASRMRQTDTESDARGRWQQQWGGYRCQLVRTSEQLCRCPAPQTQEAMSTVNPFISRPPLTTLTTTARWGKTIRTRPKRDEVKCAIGEGLEIDKARPSVVGFYWLVLQKSSHCWWRPVACATPTTRGKSDRSACASQPLVVPSRVAQGAFVRRGNSSAIRETVGSQRTRSLFSTVAT